MEKLFTYRVLFKYRSVSKLARRWRISLTQMHKKRLFGTWKYDTLYVNAPNKFQIKGIIDSEVENFFRYNREKRVVETKIIKSEVVP